MAEIKVGEISHYYDKIGVAVVELTASLKTGDTIKIKGANEFEQIVESMQMDHKSVESADKGDAIGLKVTDGVKKGDEVFKEA